ncbi:TPA: LamG domain-containing protein [bacterium]|nr:LamG domain-containing protein [bacterium]
MKVLFTTTCILLFLCSISLALDPNDKSLVGVWLFDDGKADVFADFSKNKNDAVANGAFKVDKGKFDGCVIASGGGSIDVKTSDSINSITNAITIAGWFRIDADSDTGIRRQNAYLLEDQSASEPVPDGWSFRIWTSNGISPGAYGTTKVVKGEWTHIAGTYDGKLMKLYINGVEEKELKTDGNANFNGEWAGKIGVPADTLQLKYGSESYTGGMDEIVLFSRALSKDEIVQLTKGWKQALSSLESKDKLSVTWGDIKSR